MKHTNFLFIFLFLMFNHAYSQNTTIDILINKNDENFEFQIDKLVDEFLAEKADGCINFNIIKERGDGSSPYIIELWETEEFLNQYIFKVTRKRKVEGKDGNTVEKKYTAAGINVRAQYKVFGRMTERESQSIIDLFILDGRIDKEINEDEVRKKWKIKRSERKELSDYILNKYELAILQKRKETLTQMKELLGNHLISIVANSILPPTRITGIAEQKKEKVKKVNIEKCPEIDLSQYGTFYYAIYTLEDKEGNKVYTQVGTCYFDKDPTIMGIRKGEKELLPLIKNNTPLFIGKHKSMDAHATSDEKTEKTKDISFVFFYQPTHTYTETERLNMEFIYQASFLGYKNIRVIADDKLTNSINETTSQSLYTYDPDKESDLDITVDDIKSNTTIFIGISNPKKLKSSGGLFKNSSVNEKAEYIVAKCEYKLGDIKYESISQFETYKNAIGLHNSTRAVGLKEVRAPLCKEEFSILGIAKEKKGKVKKVYVSSTTPLDEGETFKVYKNENITKKSKEFAKLKIDELVNRYIAIADVKKGDKVIAPYTDGSKPIFVQKSGGGGGFLGKALRLGGSAGSPRAITIIYGIDEKL